MADHPITIPVPDYVYDWAQRIATEQGVQVEDVLRQRLEAGFVDFSPLPADEQAELEALTKLNNDTLRMIARETMPTAKQSRMQVLMEENNKGGLTNEEEQALEALVQQGQRLTIRKAQAASILAERGEPFSANDLPNG